MKLCDDVGQAKRGGNRDERVRLRACLDGLELVSLSNSSPVDYSD